MLEQNHELRPDDFTHLQAAIVADIARHVTSLRKSGVELDGYAVLPPNYYSDFDPTTLSVAFNCESDTDATQRGEPYYRYSVDEWNNYVHEGFDNVNRVLQSLLEGARPSGDDLIGHVFVDAVYQAILDAMLTLRKDHTFDGVPYLVVWVSDSGNCILNQSAKALNSPEIYAEFASEFDV